MNGASGTADHMTLERPVSKIVAQFHSNKAGYTATPVACGWAGAVIELTKAFWQEQ